MTEPTRIIPGEEPRPTDLADPPPPPERTDLERVANSAQARRIAWAVRRYQWTDTTLAAIERLLQQEKRR